MTRTLHSLRIAVPLAALLLGARVQAAPGDIQSQQIQREEQRQQDMQQQLQPNADVRLDETAGAGVAISPGSAHPPAAETPCFRIREIQLAGDAAGKFSFALRQAVAQAGFVPGQCLGAQGINRIMVLAQNALIGRGYTTTRILAAPQDLHSGVLVLTVLPGRIRQIRFETAQADATHVGRITAFANEFPTGSGAILNLRDLEQGLENLKRLPTAEADIQIVPAEQPDESDIVVSWRQRTVPYRLSINVDNSGSKATGKYQGSLTFSADNPLGLSDLFYASFHHDLGHKDHPRSPSGQTVNSHTGGYAFHYSVPFGNWLWSWNHNYYRYHQAVAGRTEVYDYNGSSSSSDIGFTRLLYRNARRKTHLGFKLWQREAKSYIDDAEIDVQRRKTAGWQLGLTHKEYFGRATLDAALNYKRGTGMADALRAPEEVFDEGTSRMRILTADIGFNQPFHLGKQAFAYDTRLHIQWNHTPLTPLDKLAIGGRYTVRGFDGEMSLSAERGWYWHNDFIWQYHPQHQMYLGLDTGHVSGWSTQFQLGQNLAGAALGWRGQLNAPGSLNYDLFVGRPLHKPEYFRTADTTIGFNLNYSF